uniref:Uncharacterized protein n=1 Tax=Spongospora subterranea TaxID=70186 RepID=A0A0H5R6I3_9EUKA|eukprot:CRZ03874.1 hypothetical protein [Spongospora subterranea]
MGLTEVVIAGAGLSLSLVFYFLSAILDHTWWNFLALIPLMLMAIPFLFCLADSQGYAENDAWLNMGQFFTGFLGVSFFAVIFLNYHLGAIVARQFWLGLFGSLSAMGGVFGYFGWQYYKSDSFSGGFV